MKNSVFYSFIYLIIHEDFIIKRKVFDILVLTNLPTSCNTIFLNMHILETWLQAVTLHLLDMHIRKQLASIGNHCALISFCLPAKLINEFNISVCYSFIEYQHNCSTVSNIYRVTCLRQYYCYIPGNSFLFGLLNFLFSFVQILYTYVYIYIYLIPAEFLEPHNPSF